MGAWGTGNFENDAVSDWLAELVDWTSVRSALVEVLDAAPEVHVDADTCAIALGAAEAVAACLGRPGRMPDGLVEWVRAHRKECDQQARALAEACTRRIEADSNFSSYSTREAEMMSGTPTCRTC